MKKIALALALICYFPTPTQSIPITDSTCGYLAVGYTYIALGSIIAKQLLNKTDMDDHQKERFLAATVFSLLASYVYFQQ